MSIARMALRSVAVKSTLPSIAARSYSAAVMQKDVLQDLFIKELKAYKPQPVTAADEAPAKDFKFPLAPAVPEIDADLAQQLAAYDAEPEETSQ
ncbi:ATP synthase complex subunit H-domain-containing protein [Mycotypha africana]|uniref:ATP synthase complex subunit H-domain-containing protein n=1 Tax=Mycotypha africana TaxID=64632 RepID=UPI0023000C59|nr:ATP synthase complex subunit H-domain-containing protein [Mycotypha africana]KAI8969988.1 ATP synthase complex subunit H-domain-containing protein [Mycotypha africana]